MTRGVSRRTKAVFGPKEPSRGITSSTVSAALPGLRALGQVDGPPVRRRLERSPAVSGDWMEKARVGAAYPALRRMLAIIARLLSGE